MLKLPTLQGEHSDDFTESGGILIEEIKIFEWLKLIWVMWRRERKVSGATYASYVAPLHHRDVIVREGGEDYRMIVFS